MSEFILKPQALSHPLANGQYDKENTNEDFIAGYESYREWLEALPALSIETLHGIMRSICKHNKIDVGINASYEGNLKPYNNGNGIVVDNCSPSTRFTWAVTTSKGGSLAGNANYWLYLDNIKVQIVSE